MSPEYVYNWAINSMWFIVLVPTLIVLAIALITTINCLVRRQVRRQARRQAYVDSHDSGGAPYPPAGRGRCSACGQAEDRAFFLPDGRCLCPPCYEKVQRPSLGAGKPPSTTA